MKTPNKHVLAQSPSRQAAEDVFPPASQAHPLSCDHLAGEDMPEPGEWCGDPRFADFPDLGAPVGVGGALDDDMTGDEEWTGDPRFADFPTPRAHHGVVGIDDTRVVAPRPDLRIVSVEMFNAVRAMRLVKAPGALA